MASVWCELFMVGDCIGQRQVEVHAGPVAPACLYGGICRELTVKQDLESHWDLPQLDGALWLSVVPPPRSSPRAMTQTAGSPAFIRDGKYLSYAAQPPALVAVHYI